MNLKRGFPNDAVTVVEDLAEKTEQLALSTDRMKAAVNTIVDNAKIIYGVVAPLLGCFKSK